MDRLTDSVIVRNDETNVELYLCVANDDWTTTTTLHDVNVSDMFTSATETLSFTDVTVTSDDTSE